MGGVVYLAGKFSWVWFGGSVCGFDGVPPQDIRILRLGDFSIYKLKVSMVGMKCRHEARGGGGVDLAMVKFR